MTPRQALAKILRKSYADQLPVLRNQDGDYSAAAPEGEPRNYRTRTNTGGRRYIGHESELIRQYAAEISDMIGVE
jgi:hypothetical protein